MKPSKSALLCAVACSGFLAQSQVAHAQDSFLPGFLSAGGALDASDPDLMFSIGGGASYAPSYYGSDEYALDPTGSFRLDYVRFPNGFSFRSSNAVGFNDGLSLLGSAQYVSKRNSSKSSDIRGLDDVDATMELGLGVGFEQENYRVFANARYGFFGHNAFVGDAGADLIARPVEGLTLTLGPRMLIGDNSYAGTYYGVSSDEAAASGLQSFSAQGGLLGAGVEMTAQYQFNPRWGVRAELSWDRLMNDAGHSPITNMGSDDQYRISFELVRRIAIDF